MVFHAWGCLLPKNQKKKTQAKQAWAFGGHAASKSEPFMYLR